MSIESLFVNACAAKLDLSVTRIATCLGRLSAAQIWARGGENENAVGNMILHLAGNVRQWVVSGLGGAADIRKRDLEFSTTEGVTGDQLLALLRDVISQANGVIAKMNSEQLTRIYEIQTRTVSGVEAVLNVVEHFGQHTGQIIFATKQLTGDDLNLTIPRKPAAVAG